MANTTNTNFMTLALPIVSQQIGPDYASNINSALSLLDSHDHTSGKGAPIAVASLNINGDMAFNNNNATGLRSTRFQLQSANLGLALDLGCLYFSGQDLYANDGLGNQIRITQSGGVSGSPGSITGLVSPATVTYVAPTFAFQSAVNTPANLDGGSLVLRNITASSKGLTLNPPTAMASNYSVTLPALPAAQSFVTIDASGAFATPIAFTAGITAANIAPAALVPSGSIIAYGGVAAPTGYLLCDGTSYLRATYPDLFTAISTAYGTADGTHFNVPDLRGIFPRGVSGSTSNDPDKATRTVSASGGNTGNNVGSLQTNQNKSHTHTNNSWDFTSNPEPTLGPPNNSYPGAFYQDAGTPVLGTPLTIGTTGSGGTEARPINLYVNYIIKT